VCHRSFWEWKCHEWMVTWHPHVYSNRHKSLVLPIVVYTQRYPQCGCMPPVHLCPALLSFVRGVNIHSQPKLYHPHALIYTHFKHIHFPNIVKFLFLFLLIALSLLFFLYPYVIPKPDILVYQVLSTRVVATFLICIKHREYVIQAACAV
jgi:hypothetical protein